MRQIVYISTASPGIGQVDIVQILEASARNNPARDITGFLLYNGRNFLQLVEGPEASLHGLMDKISADPRHSGVVRLEDVEVTERACAGWKMKRLNLADDVLQRQADLDQSLPQGLPREVRRTVLNFAALN